MKLRRIVLPSGAETSDSQREVSPFEDATASLSIWSKRPSIMAVLALASSELSRASKVSRSGTSVLAGSVKAPNMALIRGSRRGSVAMFVTTHATPLQSSFERCLQAKRHDETPAERERLAIA